MDEEDKRMSIPNEGYARLHDIVGSKRHGIRPLLPIAASTWWAGVRAGKFPQPIRLSARLTVWRWRDVRDLLQRLDDQADRKAA